MLNTKLIENWKVHFNTAPVPKEIAKLGKTKSGETKFREPETNTKPSKTTKQKINRVELFISEFYFPDMDTSYDSTWEIQNVQIYEIQ